MCFAGTLCSLGTPCCAQRAAAAAAACANLYEPVIHTLSHCSVVTLVLWECEAIRMLITHMHWILKVLVWRGKYDLWTSVQKMATMSDVMGVSPCLLSLCGWQGNQTCIQSVYLCVYTWMCETQCVHVCICCWININVFVKGRSPLSRGQVAGLDCAPAPLCCAAPAGL